MPRIQLKDAGIMLADGRPLFQHLDVNLTQQFIAITGPNGAGKSHLLAAMAKQTPLTSGHQQIQGQYYYLPQDAAHRFNSIAAMLGVEQKLNALQRAQCGQADPHDFAIIADDWQLEQRWQAQLQPQQLQLATPFTDKSPGQRMQSFIAALLSEPAILLLDEPSNHMDSKHRHWLATQLQQHSAGVAIVSHDPVLLDAADHILYLEDGAIQHHSLGFTALQQSLAQQQRKLQQHHQAQKAQSRALQQALHKAQAQQQRQQSKGKQKVRAGSQSKLEADFKADRNAKRLAQQSHKLQQSQQQLKQDSQYYNDKQQRFYFNQATQSRAVIELADAQLPYVQQPPLNVRFTTAHRLRLLGDNGTGKSVLLKTLAGQLDIVHGRIACPTEMIYLDQHCSWLSDECSLLDAACRRLDKPQHEIITAFASVGITVNQVSQPIAQLSGGEKVKAAIIIAIQLEGYLLLDEPDNHLDINAQLELAAVLNQIPNGFMLVSHNDYFCQQLEEVRTMTLTTTGVL